MSWQATARSSYFALAPNVDGAQLRGWATTRDLTVLEGRGDQTGLVALLASTDDGDWPTAMFDENLDDFVDVDIFDEVSPFIHPEHAAVFVSVGHDKARYVGASATVVTSTSRRTRSMDHLVNELAAPIRGAGLALTEPSY